MTSSADLWAYVDELIEAHLDTIEIGSAKDSVEWDDHVRYLQSLVREALAMTARRIA